MAFVLAGLVLLGSLALAFLIAFAQGMATAPQYDNSPLFITIAGAVSAALIAATHWLPHIGW
jgi:hypothetical protein